MNTPCTYCGRPATHVFEYREPDRHSSYGEYDKVWVAVCTDTRCLLAAHHEAGDNDWDMWPARPTELAAL
jgi:hypothetical protein